MAVQNISISKFDIGQAGTSWGEYSKPDLFLTFILKVRMWRFLRHSRLKCRKSSFWEQKHCFWAFLRTEDWGLKIEDWGLRTAFSPPMTGLIFTLWDHKNPHKLEKSSKPGLNAWTICATLPPSIHFPNNVIFVHICFTFPPILYLSSNSSPFFLPSLYCFHQFYIILYFSSSFHLSL